MRDVIVTLVIGVLVLYAVRRPDIGVLAYTWVSLMSPHRLTWGFAYSLPFAQLLAITTFVGILLAKERGRFPVTPVTVLLMMLVVWENVSLLAAIDFEGSLVMWDRVMKIQLFILVTLYVLKEKKDIQALVWVVALSVGFYGAKGGLFTIVAGGVDRVYGPAGSFIEENNSLALATIMTIPLLYCLRGWVSGFWLRMGLLAAMGFCFFSVLGSHSRGGLLAVAAMLGFLWLKSRQKLVMLFAMLLVVPFAISFMPEKWDERMMSIQDYDTDMSAQGRINAWTMAWNLAKDRPLTGGGFEVTTPENFARYAPNPIAIHSAHSIYFQILGEHGFVGLAIYLLLWFFVWRDAAWVRRRTRDEPEWRWAFDLVSMIQVGLIGFAVGGAFLNLAYYDLSYNMLVMVVLTRALVERELGKQTRAWFRPAAQSSASAPPPAGRAPGAAGGALRGAAGGSRPEGAPPLSSGARRAAPR
ncbi:MAG: putative O-glycosylation ligase, exosortase A system-associated [Burkholderiales bacterium]|nr:putative O-glycosylation ligase, exosortase A system-associated [Burkholderiales bacterium]